jgi:hypothetical protein
MQATPLRLFSAVFWPLSIWTSLSHLNDHAADDYVERTSPIVATAVAFWICAALAVAVQLWSTGVLVLGDEGGEMIRRTRNSGMMGVLWFFLPVIYLIGFWLFTTRDEAFPRVK